MYLPKIRRGHILILQMHPPPVSTDVTPLTLFTSHWKSNQESIWADPHLVNCATLCSTSVVLLYWGCNYCSYSFTHIPVLSCSEKRRKKRQFSSSICQFPFFHPPYIPHFPFSAPKSIPTFAINSCGVIQWLTHSFISV